LQIIYSILFCSVVKLLIAGFLWICTCPAKAVWHTRL